MEQSVLDLAISQGIWCALFVILFFYQIRDSRKREARYEANIQSRDAVIEKFADILKIDLTNIKACNEEIKENTEKILERTG